MAAYSSDEGRIAAYKPLTRLETDSLPFGRSTAARALLACATAVTALWVLASFWFPFGWDQGFFASVGDTIVRGGMPYRDTWEIKGPLPYYAFALAEWVFGRHMWGIRLFDLPLLLIGMAALGSAAGRLTSRITGWWAAIVLAMWVGSLGWFHAAQPDGWVAIFMILATAPLLGGKPGAAQYMLAGILIGCGALVKPLYIAFAAVPLARIAGQSDLKPASRLRLAIWAGGAALVPPIAVAAWFAHREALRQLIDVHILYNLQVYSGGPSAGTHGAIEAISKYFLGGTLALAIPVIATGAHTLWREQRSTAATVLTWMTVAVACVAAQGKFYKYHWLPVFPPLVLLGSCGCYTLLRIRTEERLAQSAASIRLLCAICVGLAAFVVVQFAVVPTSDIVQWLKLAAGRLTSDQYYEAHANGGFDAGDDIEAARYIRERTKPLDGVAVWGINSEIGFLSGRSNPTRFVYTMPLSEGGPRSPRDAYRREYLAALHKNPPAYFVVGLPWGSQKKEQTLHDFPELENLLQQQYVREKQIGGLDLYRRL